MSATGTGASEAPPFHISGPSTVTRETVVNDFRERMQGKLADDTLEAAAAAMTAAVPMYTAMMIIINPVIYFRVQVIIDDSNAPTSPQFGGNGGGLFLPPIIWAKAGWFAGHVYGTDKSDLYHLCTYTHSFELHITPVYSGITFWSSYGTFIGHFEGGGLAACIAGEGGGTGSWSHCPPQ